jgi:hypothetical protein
MESNHLAWEGNNFKIESNHLTWEGNHLKKDAVYFV